MGNQQSTDSAIQSPKKWILGLSVVGLATTMGVLYFRSEGKKGSFRKEKLKKRNQSKNESLKNEIQETKSTPVASKTSSVSPQQDVVDEVTVVKEEEIDNSNDEFDLDEVYNEVVKPTKKSQVKIPETPKNMINDPFKEYDTSLWQERVEEGIGLSFRHPSKWAVDSGSQPETGMFMAYLIDPETGDDINQIMTLKRTMNRQNAKDACEKATQLFKRIPGFSVDNSNEFSIGGNPAFELECSLPNRLNTVKLWMGAIAFPHVLVMVQWSGDAAKMTKEHIQYGRTVLRTIKYTEPEECGTKTIRVPIKIKPRSAISIQLPSLYYSVHPSAKDLVSANWKDCDVIKESISVRQSQETSVDDAVATIQNVSKKQDFQNEDGSFEGKILTTKSGTHWWFVFSHDDQIFVAEAFNENKLGNEELSDYRAKVFNSLGSLKFVENSSNQVTCTYHHSKFQFNIDIHPSSTIHELSELPDVVDFSHNDIITSVTYEETETPITTIEVLEDKLKEQLKGSMEEEEEMPNIEITDSEIKEVKGKKRIEFHNDLYEPTPPYGSVERVKKQLFTCIPHSDNFVLCCVSFGPFEAFDLQSSQIEKVHDSFVTLGDYIPKSKDD